MNVDESYFKWPQDGFTENKDDETFHLTCNLLYLMAGRGVNLSLNGYSVS